MAYEVSWHIPDKILLLRLSGDYTLDEGREVDTLLLKALNDSPTNMGVLIDARAMNRPYNFQAIRDTQTYMNHRHASYIFVVASDRIIKLAMLVIFNLSHAYLITFDDFEAAQTRIQRQLSSFIK
ncbi:MAG: hypothetical protein H7Y11_09150 [Armatimonadetes bacterium]|nr:hypothetical protein [Anaerolineae bacterium]